MAPGATLTDALSTARCLLPEGKVVHARKIWLEAEIWLEPIGWQPGSRLQKSV